MINVLSENKNSGNYVPAALFKVWKVVADSSYKIKNRVGNSGRYIIIRTIEGEGRLVTVHVGYPSLKKDSLLYVRYDEICEYAAVGNLWRFFWFETDENARLPTEVALMRREFPSESRILERIFTLLSLPFSENGAVFLFNYAVSEWRDLTIAGDGNDDYAVKRLITDFDFGGESAPDVSALAEAYGFSDRTLRTHFKKYAGIPPKKYMLEIKIGSAKELLETTNLHVSEIAYSLGFSSPYYFSRLFREKTGCSPKEYRRLSALRRER